MESNQIIVLDRGDYTTCTVNLQGATVTSWRIRNIEQLFVSRESNFHQYMNIEGGIHLVFPRFGPWSFGPTNGFASVLPWSVEKRPKKLENGDVIAVFSLRDDCYTQALWAYRFKLSCKITLGRNNLIYFFDVENPCHYSPLEFHILQHCLFRVPDASKCEISGFDSNTSEDELNKEPKYSGDVTLSKGVDKIFRYAPGEVTVSNMMNGCTLKINKRGIHDFNVLTPTANPSAAFSELGNEFQNAIVVKGGMVTKFIRIEPMTCWAAYQIFEFVEPRSLTKEKKMEDFYALFDGYC